jgi:hypothetical protein
MSDPSLEAADLAVLKALIDWMGRCETSHALCRLVDRLQRQAAPPMPGDLRAYPAKYFTGD